MFVPRYRSGCSGPACKSPAPTLSFYQDIDIQNAGSGKARPFRTGMLPAMVSTGAAPLLPATCIAWKRLSRWRRAASISIGGKTTGMHLRTRPGTSLNISHAWGDLIAAGGRPCPRSHGALRIEIGRYYEKSSAPGVCSVGRDLPQACSGRHSRATSSRQMVFPHSRIQKRPRGGHACTGFGVF